MQLTSEIVLKALLPALRTSIAKQLDEKNFSQIEIASLLGITQAAVSKYLSGNYSVAIKVLEETERIKKISAHIVGKIIKTRKKQDVGQICKICRNYSGICLYRHFAFELAEALRGEG